MSARFWLVYLATGAVFTVLMLVLMAIAAIELVLPA